MRRSGPNSPRLAIEDDGPVHPGRRLDERGSGHGVGPSTVRALAELNGGTLALAERSGGGLAPIVTQPLGSATRTA